MTHSTTSVNFLDITLYKDEIFEQTGRLNTMTYQKKFTLQVKSPYIVRYLSRLPAGSRMSKSSLKGLIIGEAIRYIFAQFQRNI